jgi:hypothetical protein
LETFLAAVSSQPYTAQRYRLIRKLGYNQESDITCKRNAFVALSSVSHDSAVQYLLNSSESIDSMDELMQMAVIELIRADAKGDSPNRVSLSSADC